MSASQQAEELLCALLDRRELGVAVELGRDPGGLDRLAHGVLHGEDGLAVLVVDDAVELRLGVGDPAVVRDRLVLERVADALDAGLVLGRLELLRLELGDGVLDRLLALGRVEPLPLGRGEDEVEDAALLGRELGLDQVGRLLRVGARDLELVLQAAADGRDEHDQAGDDPDPGEDDAPRVCRAGAHPRASPPVARRSCAARRSAVFGCLSVRPVWSAMRSSPFGRSSLRRASSLELIGRRREYRGWRGSRQCGKPPYPDRGR